MTLSNRQLVFLDTETGGLPQGGTYPPLVEVAWQTFDCAEPKVLRIPHDTTQVQDEAKKINGYDERALGDPATWASQVEIEMMLDELQGVTLVGANPAFDAGFIEYWLCPNGAPWHYRLLDLESMAFGILRSPEMPGMKQVYDELRTRGYAIPAPDHTATGDVRCLLAAYKILRYL